VPEGLWADVQRGTRADRGRGRGLEEEGQSEERGQHNERFWWWIVGVVRDDQKIMSTRVVDRIAIIASSFARGTG
jgi:hypothetical protein